MHAITKSGWVEVVTGSMFSGKTEELLRRLRRAEIAGQEVAVFSPAVDDRYGKTTVGSHDGRTWEATVVGNDGGGEDDSGDEGESAIEDESGDDAGDGSDGAWAIYDHLAARDENVNVVAVDEGNFFGPELVDVAESLADDGYRVVVCGLDTTFRGEPFEPMPHLMAVAEYVEKLRAICSVCGEPATRTQRLVDGEPAHVDDPTVLVGAEESYEARCRNCHTLRRA
ncbi:thymidine kinase [Salinigranum rubrum]|uniref:Thymidine kinase n=1 Tax=Salinigranum rubrum TaxID=755307 RepID=A0A2I8VJR4_9EURY|nr:thymidine kinase [Salinigranum rubrum]AUV82156.1 thymidine kinase [Salinigranum rubrum]